MTDAELLDTLKRRMPNEHGRIVVTADENRQFADIFRLFSKVAASYSWEAQPEMLTTLIAEGRDILAKRTLQALTK